MAEIWVIAEHRGGAFRKVTLEALSAARRLAPALGAEVVAVVLGPGLGEACPALGKYGAAKVLYAEDAAFAAYTTDAYAQAVAALAGERQPVAILLPASMQGKDLGGRLAAKLATAIAVDCVALDVEDGRLVATRPMYAGKVQAKVAMKSLPFLASLRPNVFEVAEGSGTAAVETVTPALGALKTRVVEVLEEAAGKIELTEAQIIVSGGRGMKEAANFKIIEELAAVLKAAVGASRSAVDAGWRPHTDQVGQTGKVVTPNLYVACGISGAIQHLAGMGSSKFIVAINKDPDAPIHGKADFSVVGDLFEVVPALTAELRKVG